MAEQFAVKTFLGLFMHVARLVVGVLLVLLGIIGLFLPVLQGVLFICMGLALLGVDKKKLARAWSFIVERAHRVRAKFRRRKPTDYS
ncbi:MAG: hypothetical protein J7M12_04640 [Candidatus Hydrogenedentes bacterium]|nr:hypothetical protein [Candidatus Hydrogenedentota bacterium]